MYAIYLQCPNGRFHPLDLTRGETVNRLLFASLFKDRATANAALQHIYSYSENSDLVMEVRKVGR